MPTIVLESSKIPNDNLSIVELIVHAEIAPSKNEARRLVQQGGISVDNEKISDVNFEINKSNLVNGVVVKKGKKIFKKVILK